MEQILVKIPDYVQLIALLGMVLSILATVVVRITPSKLDDEKVSVWTEKVAKAIAWLPTLGINPRTKALEEAYKQLKEDKNAVGQADKPAQ